MLRTIRIGIALSLGLSVACGGPDPDADAGLYDAGTGDAGTGDAGTSDAGTSDAGGQDAGAGDGGGPGDAGTSERRTYVIDSISVPQNAAQAAAVSVDLDGDGTPDNQLGQALSAFASATSHDASGDVDQAVRSGAVILLIEALADSFASDGPVEGRMLLGESPTPAPCATPDDVICGAHLAGTGTFEVGTPAPAPSTGTIAADRLTLGPGDAWIVFALFGELVVMPITRARIQAELVGDGLGDGIVTGAVRRADVDTIAIPALHAGALRLVARDCDGGVCTPGSEGEVAVSLFDDDADGVITLEEVRGNGVLQSVLEPDLDLDADGTRDALSAGVGLTAVPATFPAP